jgi:Cof subfamily protein (haloacid dehalogenase superfamily)
MHDTKKIRLIAIDIDGTLLNDQKQIPPENIDALRQAQANGVAVAIASGRMPPLIESIQDRLDMDCALISYNGGRVVGKRADGRPVIYDNPLPADIARVFVEYSRREGHLLNFFYNDQLYAECGDNREIYMAQYHKHTGADYCVTDLTQFDGCAPSKVILLTETEVRDRLYDQFVEELGERAAIVKTEPMYLEVMAPGVNKGAALPTLAEYCGITTDEILAIGDADNDTSMVAAAGIGVAVANGSAATLEAADYITEHTNNDGGVAEAVHRFVL